MRDDEVFLPIIINVAKYAEYAIYIGYGGISRCCIKGIQTCPFVVIDLITGFAGRRKAKNIDKSVIIKIFEIRLCEGIRQTLAS